VSDIVVIGRREYGTGLQVPRNRESGLRLFSSVQPMMTRDQVNKLLTSKNRMRARKRFDRTWIKMQFNLGACNGFALAAGAERIRVKRGLPRRKYSGFAMYAAINGGSDRGSQLKDGNVWSSTKGVPEEIAGEKPEYRWSRIPQVQKDSMKNNIMLEPLVINDELELAVASVMGYPVIVACHASARWGSLDGDGIGGASDGMGNHAVLVDDIALSRSGEWLFDTANSWDVDWGDEGRLYQTWKRHFRTPIKFHQFYALRTTIDGDFQGPVIQGTPFARRAA